MESSGFSTASNRAAGVLPDMKNALKISPFSSCPPQAGWGWLVMGPRPDFAQVLLAGKGFSL
jgi:hypothetical protein